MEETQIRMIPQRPMRRLSKLKLRPIEHSGKSLKAADDEELLKELAAKPDNSFGILYHGDKGLDMDVLTKRILKKGVKEFKKPVKALLQEVPPDCENGQLLTHAQVCRMFDVVGMTIYHWRKNNNLPVIILEGGRRPPVRYDEGALLAWAKLYDKKVINHDYLKWC